MSFICLTRAKDGTKIYFNIDHVVAFTDRKKNGSELVFHDGSAVDVEESTARILDLIYAARHE